MAALDEDALVCDFAEIYHVFDYRALPIPVAATLAAGFPLRSRTMRKILAAPYMEPTVLLASIADRVSHLIWMLSTESGKPETRPKGFLELLTRENAAQDGTSYESGAAFDDAWQAIMKSR